MEESREEGISYLQSSLVQAFAIAMISIAIAIGIPLANVQGQIITLQPFLNDTLLEDEALVTFNATYWNGTQAILDEVVLNFEESDQIIQFINAIIQSDEEALEDLDLEELEPEIEEEEIEGSDGDGDGGSSNGNDNDSGNDGNDNDSEPEEPIETIIPGIGPPGEEDEPIDEGAEEELALELENPCGAAYPAMVGAGPPPECREKYLEAIEKARQTPPSDLSKE